MPLEAIKLALQAIRRNLLRSFLTILGIVIGVAAVIAMVTIGNGTTARIAADIGELGSNLLFVRPGQLGPGSPGSSAKPFSSRDVEALRAELGGIRAVAPVAQKGAVVVFGSGNRATMVTGTDNAYLVAGEWTLAEGRPFLDGEIRAGRAACVIGETVRKELFGSSSPLRQSVRVGKMSCEVIGLLKAKGESGFGTDQDDLVLMPLRTFQRRVSGNADVYAILVSVKDGFATSKAQAEIQRLLRERRKLSASEDDDFTVRDMKQITETMTSSIQVMTQLLGAVAAVSLLVGGIGIMNIMLVSVTERTREIGIRLAIGALENQVLAQFLVEASMLSLFGGMVGIVLGLGLAWMATRAMTLPFLPDAGIVAVAFLFSALVGVVFGFFPARRAARLNPIEALRHE